VRIVVIGAGLIGVTTAWYLAEQGHAVTVLDRNPAPAEGASFANGGLVTPSTSDS
jgi:D-amino-acid dehydrogenase